MFTNRRAVLHVDDDPLITQLVGGHLRGAGYEFEAIHDPLETLQAIVRRHYRIVILDEDMPGRNGLEVLQEIKRLDGGVRVIMLTGLVEERTIREANRFGAEACLFKPLTDPQPLIDVVDDAARRNDGWWRSLHELTQRRRAAEGCPII